MILTQVILAINVILVLMVGICPPLIAPPVQVRQFLNKYSCLNILMAEIYISGCDCNSLGTSGTSSNCDGSGTCSCTCDCDASLGYSAGDDAKCTDCLDGWYWTEADQSCTGNYLSISFDLFIFI